MGIFWDQQSIDDPIIVCEVSRSSVEWAQIEQLFFNASDAQAPGM